MDDYSIRLHPVWPESAHTTRSKAERLYHEIRSMVRQEKTAGASHNNRSAVPSKDRAFDPA